uniref:Uncharacterized protein n=1 Tax=Rangifer tarandus platyrhynchus TaxID=3082113 RepID=A0ACB0E4I7_RANTA|nr:unnamed protein product [Rangifer tarandus platyrhynchus]
MGCEVSSLKGGCNEPLRAAALGAHVQSPQGLSGSASLECAVERNAASRQTVSSGGRTCPSSHCSRAQSAVMLGKQAVRC